MQRKAHSLRKATDFKKHLVPSFLEFLTEYSIPEGELQLKASSTVNIPAATKTTRHKASSDGRQKANRRWYNLNRVDSVFLESLPRIGPHLAGRICRYRSLLGGFYSADQLGEVWGIHPEQLLAILPWFHVGEGVEVKLCADSSSWDNLRRHPYIGFEGARMIERYRNHHDLKRVSDLSLAISISDSLYRSWEPYLRICKLE